MTSANGSTEMASKLRREGLNPELIARITKVWEATKDVQSTSLDQMIATFCMDMFPEREIQIWELIAKMFTRHAPAEGKLEREELFSFFLECTMSPFTGNFKTIPEPRARQLHEEMQAEWTSMIKDEGDPE